MNYSSTVRLPTGLLGHCCLFLDLATLHTTSSVSHLFHAATRSEVAWKENSMIPGFHYSSFPSPRVRLLDSSTPLVDQFEAIRSSPHSFGRSARWLEVNGEGREVKELVQLIREESNKLDGLIIRQLNLARTSGILPSPPLNHSSTASSLRVLVIGDVHEALLTALLPTITAIRSLEILEFELCRPADEELISSSGSFSLHASFATAINQLKHLRKLILSHPVYRRMVNNQPRSNHERMIFLSNTSLDVLQTLATLAPQLTRIELCCFLDCSINWNQCTQLRLMTPLPQVTTLAIMSNGLTRELRQKLYRLFPQLTHLLDLNPLEKDTIVTNWDLFQDLPSSVVELTMSQLLHCSYQAKPPRIHTTSYTLRKITVHHLPLFTFNIHKYPVFFQTVFRNVEEFHVHDEYQSSDNHFDLRQFMPNLRFCRLRWRAAFQNNSSWQEFLETRFPSLTKLQVIKTEGEVRSAYEARTILEAIPLLKEVKWNDEPWLSLDRIESYYSWENIDKRQKQRLNLDRLDQIQPILQQINTSPLPPTLNLDLLSLTLIFQFLTPLDLFSAHRVCRSYRVAAVSPLVLRPNIRVRMDHEKGVIVSGTQVSFTSIKPMLSAVRSMLFQNIRILTLPPPLESALKELPREPDFYHYHLNRFELIPYFHSLHTLALDWSFASSLCLLGAPSVMDQTQRVIECVLQSATLKHLKVLKLTMPPNALFELMLIQCITHLCELETVELREGRRARSETPTSISFGQLGKLKHLKQLFINREHTRTTLNDLNNLAELIQTSDSIESIYWRPLIQSKLLEQVNKQLPVDATPHLSRIKSVSVSLDENISPSLTTLIGLFPSLIHLQLHWERLLGRGKPGAPPDSITFPLQLCKQLVSLEIFSLNHAHSIMVVEALGQSVSAGAAWSRLVRFSLIDLIGYQDKEVDPQLSLASCPDSLLPFLLAATSLTNLTFEGMSFPYHCLDLERLPWLSRLRILQLSHPDSIHILLPHSRSLIEFRTRLEFRVSFLSTTLLALPHLQSVTFRDQSLTRHQLHQYHGQRPNIDRMEKIGRVLLAAQPSATNQSIIPMQMQPGSGTSVTSRSGDCDSPGVSSTTATNTSLTPMAATTSSSIANAASSEVEVDSLSEIFMELVQSLHNNQPTLSKSPLGLGIL